MQSEFDWLGTAAALAILAFLFLVPVFVFGYDARKAKRDGRRRRSDTDEREK